MLTEQLLRVKIDESEYLALPCGEQALVHPQTPAIVF
jgi:hypothetical protein